MRAMTSRWPVTLTLALLALLSWPHPTHGQDVNVTVEVNIIPSSCAHDLFLIIDSSGSVGQANFHSLLNATVNYITEQMIVSEECTHVGVIAFSRMVETIGLSSNLTYLSQEIPTLRYQGQDTNTHLAFDAVRTMMSSRPANRQNVQRSVVVITDGVSRIPTASEEEARLLREMGVDIYAVGIGPVVAMKYLELLKFTGNNQERTYRQDRFDELTAVDFGITLQYQTVTMVVSATPVTSTADAGSSTIDASFSTTFSADSTISFTAASTVQSTVISQGFSAGLASSQSSGFVVSSSDAQFNSASDGGIDSTAATESISSGIVSNVVSTSIAQEESSTIAVSASTATVSSEIVGSRRVGGISLQTASASIQPTASTASSVQQTDSVVASASQTAAPPSDSLQSSIQPSPTQVSSQTSSVAIDSIASFASTAQTASQTATPPLTTSASLSDVTTTAASVSPTIDPTPTSSSSVLVSSTAVCQGHDCEDDGGDDGGDDGQETNRRDYSNTGDFSVRFDGFGIVGGICLRAAARRGFGFVPDPHDATKYFQCHLSKDGTVRATQRMCTRGLYWEQERFMCLRPENRTVKTDACTRRLPSFTIKRDGGCGLYWECDRGGVARPKSCMPFHAYFPGKGCVFTPDCTNSESEICEEDDVCLNMPSASDSGFYVPMIGGKWYMHQNCRRGTKFDMTTCSCERPAFFGPACSHSAKIPLPGDTRHDVDTGCKMKPGWKWPVTIFIKYKPSNSSNSKDRQEEILLRSNHCGKTGFFVISETRDVLNVRVFAKLGMVIGVALPLEGLPPTEWRSLTVQYTEGHLRVELSIDGLVYAAYMRGGLQVSVGACGWLAGQPKELSKYLAPFSGEMQEAIVSRC